MPSPIDAYDYINFSGNYQKKKDEGTLSPSRGTLNYNDGTTSHRCFILELDQRNGVNERLEIQFVPEGLGGTISANLQEVVVVGRNNPFLHHTGSNEMINLPLEFLSDEERNEDVKRKIDWLRSLTIRSNKGSFRYVKVVMGNLFRWEVFAVKSVQYSYTHLEEDSGFLPLRATASISLQVAGVAGKDGIISDIKIENLR